MFEPAALEVAVISFEGPDQYALAGGLGVRAKEMCRAFAALGFETSLFFVGDPGLPAVETRDGVDLFRCAQPVSAQHPAGVYDGERDKIAHLRRTLPAHIVDAVVRPAIARGRAVALFFEEWQTASLCIDTDALLREVGLRHHALLLWNANNHFGFDEIEWAELRAAATITTVSRYMKHLMWPLGVNPLVIANGIPDSALKPVSAATTRVLREAAGSPCLAFKIGRFSPDKRWHQALDAIAGVRREGLPARLLMRGGIEGFGHDVLGHAARLGLEVADWRDPVADVHGVARALAETATPLINLRTFLPDSVLPGIAAAATAVLANSGHEPFGLVGLEAMAAGGVAVVGNTGEEYARPYGNAIVIETDRGDEVGAVLHGLMERPDLDARLRRAARRDAADFAWPRILEGVLERLRFVAAQQRVAVPA